MPPRPSSGRARHASQRRSVGAEAPRATASAARRVARGNLARQTNLMKYAADNRLVRAVYHFTTAYKPLFIALVAVAVAIGVYFPVRDLYIAQRTESILQQQLEIRKKYNNSLSKEVKKYLSQEGIEDTARKELGMVMPGEKTITVQGLDDDGTDSDGSSSVTGTESDEDGETLKGADAADRDKTGSASGTSSDTTDDPTTSAEVEAVERAVLEKSPWYWKLLDKLFLFDGSNGMAVVSTGEAGK